MIDDLPEFSNPEPKRPLRAIIFGLVALLTVGGLVALGVNLGSQTLSDIVGRYQVEDYEGTGSGEVEITIAPGDDGRIVAQKLADADVVASFDAIYRPMLRTSFTIYPGTYLFPKQIPGSVALQILISGDTKIVNSVTLPEGLTARAMYVILGEQLKIPVADFEAAAITLQSKLPVEALNIEGYLFPATYKFDPGADAESVLNRLFERMVSELKDQGLSLEDSHEVLTTASLIQLEAKLPEDFFKVSRVIQNRLDIGMLLQFDSTVNYGTGGTKVTTTDEQRADQNPYNTYVNTGLPAGPIGNPGSLAIEAALRPAEGDWLYFVSINLQTGETVFTETYAEHLVQVEKFRAWIRANPSWNE